MAKKWVQINATAIIYEKDTNGDYVLDTNGDKIVVNSVWQEISSTADYDINVQIQEFPYEYE